jgi:hypothetical protein
MAGRRRLRGWLTAAAIVTVAGILAGLGWRGEIRPAPQTIRIQAALPDAVLQRLSSRTIGAGNSDAAPVSSAATAGAADPIGSAPDLKQVFDQYLNSGNPGRRRIAVRAFAACVPAFLPAAGQAPSPEPLIAALPASHRAERETAYRTLFARCHRLLAEGRVSLESTQRDLQRDPQSEAPGLQAREALLAGDFDRIEPLIGAALNSTEPAAVESLAGFALLMAQSRQADGADAATLQRAGAVDAALPWVACDLGLDCSAQSLSALQLCAVEGLCEGEVGARLMTRMAPGTVDPDAVQQQRSRLLGLIRSGRTLGTTDLLP